MNRTVLTAALMLPVKLEEAGKRLSLLEENTRKAREEAMGRSKEALQALTSEKVLAAEALRTLVGAREAEMAKLREADARGWKSLRRQHDEALSEVEAEISARKKELSEALEALSQEILPMAGRNWLKSSAMALREEGQEDAGQ